MRTKITFRAMATLVGGLILVSLLTITGRTAKADSPSVIYEPLMAYRLTSAGQEYRSMGSYGACGNTLGVENQTKVGSDWVITNTVTSTWDEFCNQLSLLRYWPDWEYGEKGSWTYDCNGNILTYLDEMVNGEDLNPYYRDTYTYDGYGNCIFSMEEVWDWEWLEYEEIIMTYDSDGNMMTKLVKYFGENSSFYTMTYDDNGNMLTKLEQQWDGSSWVDFCSETWTYDINGNKMIYEILYPDYDYGERQTMTYNAAGNWLTLLEEVYEGMWANSYRHTRQFDSDGNLVYYLLENWRGGVINNWVNETQDFYGYNGDGNCTLHYNQVWIWTYPDYLAGYWKNNEKIEYEYLPGMIRGHGFRGDNEGVWYEANIYMDLALNVNGVQQVIYRASGKFIEVTYQANPTQLMADISPYQTVYYGYQPEACATLSVSASGGTPPYTYEWENGEETASIEVCPTESTDYTVVITDAIGCMVQACTRVCVADVRCGNNLDKVMLCHCPPGNPNNCNTLCVSAENVADHLAHGDLLGACGVDYTCTELKAAPADVVIFETENDPFLKAYPNPAVQSTMVSYLVDQPGKVTIRLTNSYGQTVRTLFEGYSPGGEIQDMRLNTGDLQPGVYVLIMQQTNGKVITEKLMLQR